MWGCRVGKGENKKAGTKIRTGFFIPVIFLINFFSLIRKTAWRLCLLR